MDERIEDRIFDTSLKASRIKRTKNMYNKARLPHSCSMCLDINENHELGYALDIEFIDSFNTPYLYICKDCYESLLDDTKKSD